MKSTLIIGSTTVDIIINVPALPSRQEDINVTSQTLALGGCAYNVQTILRLTELPHILCSPVGSGIYGDYVLKEFEELHIKPFLHIENEENGCCYCFIEPDGERTFVAHHGVEYTFSENWMKDISHDSFDSIYICGIEVEEPSGWEIINFLNTTSKFFAPPIIYFAPGPRISLIEKEKMKALLSLSPVVHLNKDELFRYTDQTSIEEGALQLYCLTKNTILITDGVNGSYYYDKKGLHHVTTNPVSVVDTIGAGDAHIGAVIACRKLGLPYRESLSYANKVSALVVSTKGATLNKETFKTLSSLRI